ncbi:hypothetical protein MOK15_07835 [Sphingobium sp. BYY-5]|uniref:hypothetical protein n=1 Tax=Sphingobium sp. BYY-5 TaxID=2926400 RepID=UPI001FA7610B|nr:hypothetical protein [Sphingobium sp. BYY-5]MCI4590002.1 hypothetical protein [Sphingobium sp. BYY-5]
MKAWSLPLMLLAMAAQPAAAELVPIAFAPPVGRDLAYRIDQHRTVDGQQSRFSATRSLRFERAEGTGGGYVLHAALRTIDSDAPSAATESYRAALTPLIGVEMGFRVDATGKIVGLDDMDRVWASVDQGLARMMKGFAPGSSQYRAASAVQALFAGLSPEGRLALLAGEYQPLFLFAGGEVEDEAAGRGVRTVAGSPLGRPVKVEGVLRLEAREGGRFRLEENLAGDGVQVRVRYGLSTQTGMVEDQTRDLTLGGGTLTETRALRETDAAVR